MSGKLFIATAKAIQSIQAERAVIISALEPVIAAALAWLWFGQTLTLLQFIGGILIILAVTAMQLLDPSSKYTVASNR